MSLFDITPEAIDAARPIGAEALPIARPARDPADAVPRGRFCSVPAITRVWINRPNVQRPREQQGEHPIFDVLLPDGRHLLVWNVQWSGLTLTRHELDHPVMKGKAVAWIETTTDVWVKLTKYGPFERASAV